jgi:DNA invertase Pin-like site-specific DNA recombinase
MDASDDGDALYLRQSKGRAGIPRQRRETTAEAAKQGRSFSAEFCDKDTTAFQRVGAVRTEREHFLALLAWLPAHPGRQAWAWHADRFIRDTADAEALIRACAQGGNIIATRGGGSYDLATATGKRRLREDAVLGAYEVEHAIERITAKKLEQAAEGEWFGGPRPFGWEGIPSAPGDDRKFAGLRVREAEAELVRQAAGAVLSGTSIGAIERTWAALGITGTLGGPVTGQHIRRLLLRPRNAGILVHLGREAGPGTWPAILDEDVFRAVQSTLTDPTRLVTPGPERRWLGSGFYLCGVCGKTVKPHHVGAGTRGRAPRTVYRCPGHVSRSALPADEWVLDLMAARLARVEPAELPRDQAVPDANAIHAQIVVQRGLKGEAAGLFGQRAIDGAQLARITADADREIAALRLRLAQAVKASPLSGMPAGAEAIRGWLAGHHVSRQRVIAGELFAWVKVMPAERRGKPAGAKRGEPYFDRSAILYEWR